MLPADVFYPGTKSTDDPKCPLPALICIATVSLCAKPEIDSFAHDRRVGRLATCGDAAYRGGLLPRQLHLFPLHAIMMARLRDRGKYLSGSSARASRARAPRVCAWPHSPDRNPSRAVRPPRRAAREGQPARSQSGSLGGLREIAPAQRMPAPSIVAPTAAVSFPSPWNHRRFRSLLTSFLG